MDQVDIERMKRVLERIYPGADRETPRYQLPPLPIPEPVGEEQQAAVQPETKGERMLMAGELDVQQTMCALMGKSQECRRTLQEPLRRCRTRMQTLRTEWFLRTGESMSPPEPLSRRETGVLSLLRRAHEQLEALAEAYEGMARETTRREMYSAMGSECRAAAGTVRNLLRKAMR